jgi:hypothetical protein
VGWKGDVGQGRALDVQGLAAAIFKNPVNGNMEWKKIEALFTAGQDMCVWSRRMPWPAR